VEAWDNCSPSISNSIFQSARQCHREYVQQLRVNVHLTKDTPMNEEGIEAKDILILIISTSSIKLDIENWQMKWS
jgi:hypothetical protein